MPDGLDWEGFSLSGLIKGVPGGIAPFALRDIARKGWNLLREDLPLPAAVLKTSALDHNDAWMQSFLKLSGAVISPHGKTTMSPALFRRQLEHGAWAMTVATAQQIQVCREMGVNRIVLANQLIGRQAIRYVLDEVAAHGDLELYCLADSVAGVTQLVRALGGRSLRAPLNLLFEGGIVGGPTGCRHLATALDVARAISQPGPSPPPVGGVDFGTCGARGGASPAGGGAALPPPQRNNADPEALAPARGECGPAAAARSRLYRHRIERPARLHDRSGGDAAPGRRP